MNILIGFLSKISNSNLNLYIVHLRANQCSCEPYVDGESFKIEKFMLSVVSRSCLGRVSILSWSCLGVVLVMSRSCLGRVSVLSLSFFGDVSVLFWCGLLVFLVVFWGSFSDVLVTSRACFGEVSVMCGDGSVMFMMMSG